jgi:sulfatase modifying factor 1
MWGNKMYGLFAAVALALLAGAASASITIATVPVGNPGNAPDTTGFGEVDYTYNIGEYDVTNGQYAAFLNSVAATDTYGVYNPNMAPGQDFATSGITQSGSSGSYTYSTTGNANYPVTAVTFWDAARFANWLNNGQPTGTEDATTDNGTYTLTATAMANNTVTRNAIGTWAVSSENEWYKAAYYDPTNSTYWEYATQSDTLPSNVLSATGTNNANYYNGVYTDPTNYLTAVGAFASSPSAYGTFDQAGDVFEWNDTIFGSYRGLRGGAFDDAFDDALQSGGGTFADPLRGGSGFPFGFRVSQVPEPASMGILGFGMVGLLARRRRPHSLLPQESI